jgi:hypothetical protein
MCALRGKRCVCGAAISKGGVGGGAAAPPHHQHQAVVVVVGGSHQQGGGGAAAPLISSTKQLYVGGSHQQWWGVYAASPHPQHRTLSSRGAATSRGLHQKVTQEAENRRCHGKTAKWLHVFLPASGPTVSLVSPPPGLSKATRPSS